MEEHLNDLYNIQNPVDETVLTELRARHVRDQIDDFVKEVEAAIKSLKNSKAPGKDNITAEMIKAGGESSVDILHMLCNKICRGKTCPTDWGKAIITPIYKKNDKKGCGNNRGISLLSIPGKVYTRVLQQR